MSLEFDLFISSSENLPQIVGDLEAIVDIKPEQIDNNPYILFKFEEGERYFDIGIHEYVNDMGINFEDYEYVVTFDVRSHVDYDHFLRQFAKFIFDKLKEKGKYHLMLVEGLSKEIGRYSP